MLLRAREEWDRATGWFPSAGGEGTDSAAARARAAEAFGIKRPQERDNPFPIGRRAFDDRAPNVLLVQRPGCARNVANMEELAALARSWGTLGYFFGSFYLEIRLVLIRRFSSLSGNGPNLPLKNECGGPASANIICPGTKCETRTSGDCQSIPGRAENHGSAQIQI